MTISPRARFLGHSALGLAGVAGSAFAFPGDGADATGRGEALPDGSAAKGMITPEADRAIDAGLAYLNARRHQNGSFDEPVPRQRRGEQPRRPCVHGWRAPAGRGSTAGSSATPWAMCSVRKTFPATNRAFCTTRTRRRTAPCTVMALGPSY